MPGKWAGAAPCLNRSGAGAAAAIAAAIGGCELGPDVEQIGLRRALWSGIVGLVLGPNKLARDRVASCESCEL